VTRLEGAPAATCSSQGAVEYDRAEDAFDIGEIAIE
jgi:hypothetical protein